MKDDFQTNRTKDILTQADCPMDLQEVYLNFQQTGGQQALIIQNNVMMMFRQEAMRCKRIQRPMEGSVTFRKRENDPSALPEMGLFIGIEFILCCFNNSVPARILDIKRIHNEIAEVTICYGMMNLKLSLEKKRR